MNTTNTRPMLLRRTLCLAAALLLSTGALAGCLDPGAGRAELDLRVGKTTLDDGARVEVGDGLAAIREAAPGALTLWSQAPALDVTLTLPAASPRVWTVEARNMLADTALIAPTGATVEPLERELEVWPRWRVTLPAATGDPETVALRLAPPDLDSDEPFEIAVLSDIQSGVSDVADIYQRMNQDDEVRFVVSSGDLTEQGSRAELVEFLQKLRVLRRPFYATLGNHELGGPPEPWSELFGRGSFHFVFRGVRFSFIDSGNGSISPTVYGWLGGWLRLGRDDVHLFFTHYAPIDPIGHRNGSFRSRKEAGKLLAMLAEADVDASFYGHVHSYYAFANGGHEAYISGGGGAIPERMEGVARHYLKVKLDPARGVRQVALVRVD